MYAFTSTPQCPPAGWGSKQVFWLPANWGAANRLGLTARAARAYSSPVELPYSGFQQAAQHPGGFLVDLQSLGE
jgi:hypothetical protein